MHSIDLNADVGEDPAIANGSGACAAGMVISANTLGGPCRRCDFDGLPTTPGAGAHPGYPDRAGFGRQAMALTPAALAAIVSQQVASLVALAHQEGVRVTHVKPHGALYHAAAADHATALAIAHGVRDVDPRLVLVGLAGSGGLRVWDEAGFATAAEAFADRRYEPDGTLRSRHLAGALLGTPEEAAAQAVAIARDGYVTAGDGTRLPVQARTLCIHGDTPGAAAIAAAVRAALVATGLHVARF
jgi:UPF0271 protein